MFMPNNTYKVTEELRLPSILGDSGWEGELELKKKIYELEEKGFGDGVSGRISFTGSHSYLQGEAFLLDLRIIAEYDSPEDKKAIVKKIDESVTTGNSRMLWFT